MLSAVTPSSAQPATQLAFLALYGAEDEPVPVSYRAKQVLLVASDSMLDWLSTADREPARVAARLIDRRVLPGCYRQRYDRAFLERFFNVVEQTRNALVSDLPFLANTASELAAHAIFSEAQRILVAGREAHEREASLQRSSPDQIAARAASVAQELDALYAVTLEDADVVALFSVAIDREPN